MITVPIACVVDASVAIKLVVSEPDSVLAHQLFAHLPADPSARFLAPEFIFLECGNILWKCVQHRSLFSAAVAVAKLADLMALPLQCLSTLDLAPDALQIALAHGLTTYDSCYLAASKRFAMPLITADDRLVRKLAGTGFQIELLSTLTIPPLPPPPPGSLP